MFPHSQASCWLCCAVCCWLCGWCQAADTLDFERDIAPVLNKYCAGCHNPTDESGDFSVTTWDSLQAGTPDGPVILAGKPDASKLWQVMAGKQEPVMPPAEEPQPSAAEIERIRQWIEQGAAAGDPKNTTMHLGAGLTAPKLKAAPEELQYVSAACALPGQRLAVGKLGTIEVRDMASQELIWSTSGLPGKVNSLRLSQDGQRIVAGGGVTGLGGEITILDAERGGILLRMQGHSDSVYCACFSPDGKWIASGSYDRQAILWDATSGEQVREFSGHNGAIYDLDFDPSGQVLATASGDQTVKLWQVASGQRLDTLGQPEGEMLCVRFSADGRFLFAGGADRQIRKWRMVSRERPAINPMLVARYAHESEVLQLQLLGNDRLLSGSRDQSIKLWQVAQLEPRGAVGQTQDIPIAVCVVDQQHLLAVDIAGRTLPLDAQPATGQTPSPASATAVASAAANPSPPPMTAPMQHAEAEPNNSLATATAVQLPAQIAGVIAPAAASVKEDVDLYAFDAEAGQTWIFEVNAAREQSQLDSRIDILDDRGQGVVRTRLQAVRESYFTFRGKDSSTSDDFRLHKWEDMELDEYLYSSGEVTRLWLYPRGPDSGFKVYPGFGARNTFFDTTAVTHALGEPAYIVRELQAGEAPLPNGLPVFPIYYENDDDAQRRLGVDSRLTFVAPASGRYYLRVRDSRGFGGPDYGYRLSIQPPQPDFSLALSGQKMNIPLGSGREWSLTATRIDGLEGEITVELVGLPAGFVATNPVIIEAGQVTAQGTVFATPAAAQWLPPAHLTEETPPEGTEAKPAKPQTFSVKLVATSQIHGQQIVHELPQPLEITVAAAAGVTLQLVSASDAREPLEELTIRPGETISARIVVERNGHTGSISFGREDSGRNLPHGAFVDNIGLNGLLIPEEQTEREFFITAAPKVAPGRRQFHLRSETSGNPTSLPLWLNVLPPSADQP